MPVLLHIRHAEPKDMEAWRTLWRDYNSFYKAPKITEEVTLATWTRILDPKSPVGCLVAEENGAVTGFINYVIHPRTWDTRDTCYMEDLYVAENARGRGVARRLCGELKTLCTQKGLSRIYWNTEENNAPARKLYDAIGTKDNFVRYVIALPKSS